MQYVKAKTILSKKKIPEWFSLDYNMNIYRGCCHGCIYCDSRSECYQIDNFDEVRAKENAIQILKTEIAKYPRGIIGTGAMSDPYNPHEKVANLTREALKLIDAYKFGIAIATKSALITRDIDILSRIASHSATLVKITITTADDELAKKVEPNVSSPSERFLAINELSRAGIFSGILLMPVLPFIEDNPENITSIVKKASVAGAKFIYPAMGMTLRSNQRDYYYAKLDNLFPGIKERYIKTYGTSYNCASEKAAELYTLFKNECTKYGILYKMRDIITEYQKAQKNFTPTLF